MEQILEIIFGTAFYHWVCMQIFTRVFAIFRKPDSPAKQQSNRRIGLVIVGVIFVAYSTQLALHGESRQTHYNLLKGNYQSSVSDLKSNFRQLSKIYHPDKIEGGNATMFNRLREAYETLSDPDKKKLYDRFGPESAACRDEDQCFTAIVPGAVLYYALAAVIIFLATWSAARRPVRTWSYLALVALACIELYILQGKAEDDEGFFMRTLPPFRRREVLREVYFILLVHINMLVGQWGTDTRNERQVLIDLEAKVNVLHQQMNAFLTVHNAVMMFPEVREVYDAKRKLVEDDPNKVLNHPTVREAIAKVMQELEEKRKAGTTAPVSPTVSVPAVTESAVVEPASETSSTSNGIQTRSRRK
eukprot:Colp12_sorted_trinity150504_noHs@13303